MNSIEMIDYIFNRYAFLGLPETATEAEIRTALKTKKVANHPDRLVKIGPEVQQAAAQVRLRIAECEEVLLNSARKTYFDTRLTWFKEHRPRAISLDGHAIILLDTMSLNLPVLLGQKVQSEMAAELIQQAKAMTGYDPATTAKLRKAYEATHDTDLKDVLIKALYAELTYLSVVSEDDAWSRVGIHNKAQKIQGYIHSPEDYATLVLTELDRVVQDEVTPRLAEAFGLIQLGVSAPLLMLSGPEKPDSKLPMRPEDVKLEDLEAQVAKAVAAQRAKIAEVAEQKQRVLQEIANLTDLMWFTPQPGSEGQFTLLLLVGEGDNQRVGLVIEGDDAHHHLKENNQHTLCDMTLAQLKEMTFSNDTIGVPMLFEIEHPLMLVEPAVQKRRQILGNSSLG